MDKFHLAVLFLLYHGQISAVKKAYNNKGYHYILWKNVLFLVSVAFSTSINIFKKKTLHNMMRGSEHPVSEPCMWLIIYPLPASVVCPLHSHHHVSLSLLLTPSRCLSFLPPFPFHSQSAPFAPHLLCPPRSLCTLYMWCTFHLITPRREWVASPVSRQPWWIYQ